MIERIDRRLWLLALLTAGGAALRFATVAQQSYWYDEAVTASLVDRSFGGLLSGIVESESTPPLYYLLAWLWAHLLGSEEGGLRSLSALLGALMVPVAYAAGRAVVSSRAGLGAAAIAATSPVLVWYSQEARAYALLVLLGGASFFLFALARSEPSRRLLALWAVLSGLAIATHYFAAFLVAAEAALLVAAHPRLRRIYAACAGPAAMGLALMPLAVVQASHRHVGWIGTIALEERIGDAAWRLTSPSVPSTWAGAIGSPDVPYAWLAGVVVLGAAAVALLARGSRRERLGGALALSVAAAAILVPAWLSAAADAFAGGRGDLFLDRNVLGAWVPLTVFVAAGLTARRTGVLGPACLGLLVAGSLAVVLAGVAVPELQRDDWRHVADAVPSRALVAVYPRYQSAALVRQRPDLEPLVGSARADTIVVVLAGFDSLPDTFRIPGGFARTGTERAQNFTLVFVSASDEILVSRSDMVSGPPEEADVEVLAPR